MGGRLPAGRRRRRTRAASPHRGDAAAALCGP